MWQVFQELSTVLAQVHATLASQKLVKRSRSLEPSPTNLVAKAINNFTAACPENDERLTQIVSNIGHFKEASNAWIPSSWNKTRLAIDGMQAIDLKNVTTMRKVTALCKTQKLKPPSGFVKTNSFHYGKYCKKKLISVLSISVMNLNKVPGAIAVSVDLAASVDTNHSMTIAIDSVKKNMRRRRNKCVLFAQVRTCSTCVVRRETDRVCACPRTGGEYGCGEVVLEGKVDRDQTRVPDDCPLL